MWLPEVGAYHYKARVYDPELGRFLQTDPIGYADGPNMYAYVRNDAVIMKDPLGLACGGPAYTDNMSGMIVVVGCMNGPTSAGASLGFGGNLRSQGGERLGGNGSGQNQTKSTICNTPLPGGGTIRQNAQTIRTVLEGEVEAAEMSPDPWVAGLGTLGFWAGRVGPGGAWGGRLGEPWGNYNYGATGRAAGLSLETVQRIAGGAESLESLGIFPKTGGGQSIGSPWGPPPYGDNPKAQQQIKEGYNAGC